MEGGRRSRAGRPDTVPPAGRRASRPGDTSRAPSMRRPTRSPRARPRPWFAARTGDGGAGSSRSRRRFAGERLEPAGRPVGRPVVDHDDLVRRRRRCRAGARVRSERSVRGSSRAMSWTTTTTLRLTRPATSTPGNLPRSSRHGSSLPEPNRRARIGVRSVAHDPGRRRVHRSYAAPTRREASSTLAHPHAARTPRRERSLRCPM